MLIKFKEEKYINETIFIPTGEKQNITVGFSKKDFKKAIGHLYKERMVVIAPDGTVSLPPKQ